MTDLCSGPVGTTSAGRRRAHEWDQEHDFSECINCGTRRQSLSVALDAYVSSDRVVYVSWYLGEPVVTWSEPPCARS